ncbi:p21-activated protein kinase-interacting protein 1-like [Chanos chanos]|uniref:P21-activated protein kinase-interacting protein 1-like n=1 Tax=Chanos chanos TaxID=29144 RepID=A0A6J2UZM9_CHACN|nr:p21-activated protein kinase-interacting protein 1 [Chanos chanos]
MLVELITGSYEQIAFGYRVCPGEKEWTLTPVFTHHAHTASLSSVASSERFIATGSKDETIQLYDMKKRTEHGSLLHHDGSISCLQFYGTSHLLSGGEDGLLCVWSTKKWECLKSIKAHKGSLTALSVHPSGKLALSVGTDKTLRTWNLIDGRSAFIKNIKQNAHIVLWSPEGSKYVVVINEKVDVYSLDTASVISTIRNPKRISTIKFLKENLLAVAGDEETVRIYDLTSQKCVCEFTAHETRVKAIDSFTTEDTCVVVTASNDGFIKLWKVNLEVLDPPVLLGQVNTTARLTCLSVWQSTAELKDSGEHTGQATTSQVSEDASQLSKKKRMHISSEEVVLQEDSGSKPEKKQGKKKKQKVQ